MNNTFIFCSYRCTLLRDADFSVIEGLLWQTHKRVQNNLYHIHCCERWNCSITEAGKPQTRSAVGRASFAHHWAIDSSLNLVQHLGANSPYAHSVSVLQQTQFTATVCWSNSLQWEVRQASKSKHACRCLCAEDTLKRVKGTDAKTHIDKPNLLKAKAIISSLSDRPRT